MTPKEPRVRQLIFAWENYRGSEPIPARFLTLKKDLYLVRNGGGGAYPARLIDTDDEVMASVEHYFLCRAWVGNAIFPSWQMRAMKGIYNTGKELGLTPRHNPNKPVTPPSAMQAAFQEAGVRDGEGDLKVTGAAPPLVAKPPQYW